MTFFRHLIEHDQKQGEDEARQNIEAQRDRLDQEIRSASQSELDQRLKPWMRD